MSNERIANQFLARLKFAEATAPYGAIGPFFPFAAGRLGKANILDFAVDLLLGVLRIDARSANCASASGNRLAAAGTTLGIARIRRCLNYQITHTPNQILLLEACHWFGIQPIAPEYVLTRDAALGKPLTPYALMTGWPDWLVALGLMLVLSRRTWVYSVLLSARDPSAGWLDRLLARYAIPDHGDRERNALWMSVCELQMMAVELEGYYDSMQRGRFNGDFEKFLRRLMEAFSSGFNLSTDLPSFATWILNDNPIPSLGHLDTLPVKALREVLRLSTNMNLPKALHELNQRSDPSLAVTSAELPIWLGNSAMHPEQPGFERPPDEVVQRLGALVPWAGGAGPEVVIGHGELAGLIRENLGGPCPEADIVAGLLVSMPWEEAVRNLQVQMPAPEELDDDLLVQVVKRLKMWELWVNGLGGGAPVYPPPPGMPPEYWLFLEVPPSLWAKAADIQQAWQCAQEWLEGGARPASWDAVGATEEEPLRAALASLYLDKVVDCLVGCYRDRRRNP
jgi:hypothetical protein